MNKKTNTKNPLSSTRLISSHFHESVNLARFLAKGFIFLILFPKFLLANIDLDIIKKIESGGCKSPCIGDNGKALGPYQLHFGVIKDYNRYHNTDFSHRIALSEDFSRMVADWYLNTEIPRLIAFYRKKDTLKNRLTAYNMGISAVVKNKLADKYIAKYKKLKREL